ncbi:TPA: DUF4288 domain-containing protein [Stenotrophomonas maltophilia]|jgi:hypothetical protein|uniref:DUF4288 domain-containing protein n=1 Tax=Stenotrophomonas TaxID=40323 RepID=UPI000EB5E037|nr:MULTISPECIES: DUF4288 domain-containing protein [Stenotrophomonas]EKU9958808.1 DUF4288 domain-containing protein [Stenotrophomonas maltophilia]EKU9985256.1 DUF4288 domain-containing protein [Stenotrophomonas maltophilia]HEL2979802.1 DUF4288 domain-containing protein [Stenotrophomonas maltophilia]HEL3256866.1 DUF4288 domain-containing protein [Stenotrophomonas maltophilia]HEL5039369.1 DUF4288 domain-containing protein [Stenotrophomonas maltophilia]
MWYCAHAVFFYQYEGQDSFVVHENVYLIGAEDEEKAMFKAKSIALEYEQIGVDSYLECDGKRAEYKFSGIRKLISVQVDSDVADSSAICSGVELTYSVMEVGSILDVERIARGELVAVNYIE